MKEAEIYLLLNLFVTVSVQGDTFGPFGETATAIASLWRKIFHSQENCDSEWISFKAEALKADLDSKLIGQHIASSIIQDAVTGFMRDNNPRKPLVLSLHGPSGTGKNFVSKLIAENIYKTGMDSSFVHVFTSQLHFPHSGLIDTYKSQLKQWIKGNVSNCERSMFIFDEMEKMPPSLFDSITPYLDYYVKLDGVSYRKAIFIFLSNDGGEVIKETALQFWREGRDRKEIELKDLETAIAKSALKCNTSGFWHSDLIEKNMIDFFVPFLPLEYQHVVQCAMAEMKASGLVEDRSVVDKMARDLDYFPKFERAFSTRGCKTIDKRIKIYKKTSSSERTCAQLTAA